MDRQLFLGGKPIDIKTVHQMLHDEHPLSVIGYNELGGDGLRAVITDGCRVVDDRIDHTDPLLVEALKTTGVKFEDSLVSLWKGSTYLFECRVATADEWARGQWRELRWETPTFIKMRVGGYRYMWE